MARSRSAPLLRRDDILTLAQRQHIVLVDATWFPPWVTRSSDAAVEIDTVITSTRFDIDVIAEHGTDLPHMLPSAMDFASHMDRLGIGNRDTVIVFDRNGYFASARVWWMFRAFGHNDVYVVDGGHAELTKDGPFHALTPAKSPSGNGAEEGGYVANLNPFLLSDMETVRGTIGTTATSILDARPKARFDGTSPEPRPSTPSGHVPGSMSIPHSAVINEYGYIKSKKELNAIFSGVAHRQSIICTCGSGVSAAVLALALAQIGRWDISVYDGSWSEWASHPSNEIARSTE